MKWKDLEGGGNGKNVNAGRERSTHIERPV